MLEKVFGDHIAGIKQFEKISPNTAFSRLPYSRQYGVKDTALDISWATSLEGCYMQFKQGLQYWYFSHSGQNCNVFNMVTTDTDLAQGFIPNPPKPPASKIKARFREA